jgi:hypothetical protein
MSVAIKNYNLDNISYVPLYPPQPIAYKVEIVNTSSVAINLRSDPNDSTTQIQLFPGESKPFESSKNQSSYNPSAPIIFAILTSGTGTVKVIAH